MMEDWHGHRSRHNDGQTAKMFGFPAVLFQGLDSRGRP